MQKSQEKKTGSCCENTETSAQKWRKKINICVHIDVQNEKDDRQTLAKLVGKRHHKKVSLCET